MSNRWRQGLFNEINKEKNQVKNKEVVTQKDVQKIEKLDGIRDELEDTPVITDEEFEEFENRITEATE